MHKEAVILTSSADPSLRVRGARALLANADISDFPDVDRSGNVALVLSTMEDANAKVLKSLYSDPNSLVAAVGGNALLNKMERLLGQNGYNMSLDVLSIHVDFLRFIPQEGERFDLCGMLLFPHLLVTKAGFKRSAMVWMALSQPRMVGPDAAFLRSCSRTLANVDWKVMRGDQAAMSKFNERIVDLMTSQSRAFIAE